MYEENKLFTPVKRKIKKFQAIFVDDLLIFLNTFEISLILAFLGHRVVTYFKI